ncbi:opacity protein-like surface antigen [Dysgonomonas hofstadii]|uniref:Opacity protein-like surface antigen n=1 Tax=Dysgonomonas hofstadii TaxID=637886 RepID=A0A840CTL0_9BACT|nr:outer membrane beta-barrel protein [Dysgonomonas hofstadii]MBB4037024.1 opacity protein-like surface antigen [Dysgonomonas hofstadii]
MKRISSILIIIILATASTVSAQDAGQMWIGGSVGFSTNKTTDQLRTNYYKILPEIGYVLSANWGIGLSLGYTHNENNTSYYSTNDNSLKYTLRKDNGFTVNPFVRYSFLKGDLGSMFVDGGIDYTYSKTKLDDKSDISSYYKDYSQKNNTFGVGFRPGVALKISDKVVLTAKYGFIGYWYNKYTISTSPWDYGNGNSQTENKEDHKTNSFQLDFDFRQALFGVNFIF